MCAHAAHITHSAVSIDAPFPIDTLKLDNTYRIGMCVYWLVII